MNISKFREETCILCRKILYAVFLPFCDLKPKEWLIEIIIPISGITLSLFAVGYQISENRKLLQKELDETLAEQSRLSQKEAFQQHKLSQKEALQEYIVKISDMILSDKLKVQSPIDPNPHSIAASAITLNILKLLSVNTKNNSFKANIKTHICQTIDACSTEKGEVLIFLKNSLMINKVKNTDNYRPPINLEKADFNRSVIIDQDLSKTDLSSVNFTDSNLFKSDFKEAKLNDAIMTGADLREANFTDAEPLRVDFTKADLSGAKFNGADLKGVIFNNTIFNEKTSFKGVVSYENIQIINSDLTKITDIDPKKLQEESPYKICNSKFTPEVEIVLKEYTFYCD